MNLFYVLPELSIFAVVYGKNVSYLQFFDFESLQRTFLNINALIISLLTVM